MESVAENFGVTLRAFRTEKNWTLKQLAQRTDLSISQLSALEKGTREPSWDGFYKICTGLDVSPELFHIVNRTEQKESFEKRHLLREFAPLMNTINDWIAMLKDGGDSERTEQKPVENPDSIDVVIKLTTNAAESDKDYECVKLFLKGTDVSEDLSSSEKRELIEGFAPFMEKIKGFIDELKSENQTEQQNENQEQGTQEEGQLLGNDASSGDAYSDNYHGSRHSREVNMEDSCLV